MKKFILLLAVLIFALQANAAMTYKDASAENGKKAMAVLVYARWAQNYDYALEIFRNAQGRLGKSYNYVELDIASDDAKEYSEKYSIRSKLPYIALFRSNGEFQRYLDRNCTSDLNCAVSKMKSFLRK